VPIKVFESVRITGTGDGPEVRVITRSDAIATKQSFVDCPAGLDTGTRSVRLQAVKMSSGRRCELSHWLDIPHLDSFTASDTRLRNGGRSRPMAQWSRPSVTIFQLRQTTLRVPVLLVIPSAHSIVSIIRPRFLCKEMPVSDWSLES
jgi:hypothetical protein